MTSTPMLGAWLILLVALATNQMGVVAQQGEGVEKIGSFSPPEMTAEETDSAVLPRHLRCDGAAGPGPPPMTPVGCSVQGDQPPDDAGTHRGQ